MKLSLAIPWPFLTPLIHTLAVSTNRQHIFGPDVGNSVCVCCLFCETVSPRGRHHVHVPSQPHPSVRLQATQEGVLLLCWVANWGATRGAGVCRPCSWPSQSPREEAGKGESLASSLQPAWGPFPLADMGRGSTGCAGKAGCQLPPLPPCTCAGRHVCLHGGSGEWTGVIMGQAQIMFKALL